MSKMQQLMWKAKKKQKKGMSFSKMNRYNQQKNK